MIFGFDIVRGDGDPDDDEKEIEYGEVLGGIDEGVVEVDKDEKDDEKENEGGVGVDLFF